MTAEVVSFLFSEENLRKGLQSQIIFQCAAFLKGIKTASMLNVKQEECRDLELVLCGTDVK